MIDIGWFQGQREYPDPTVPTYRLKEIIAKSCGASKIQQVHCGSRSTLRLDTESRL